MNTAIIISVIVCLLLISVVFTILYFTGTFTPSIDCKVGEWGVCDKDTGKRTRVVTQAKQGKGSECPVLVEDCDIDCVMGKWTDCINDIQTRDIITHPKNNGLECAPLLQDCISPPNLQADTIQWQYNCPEGGDCSGLVWTSVGPTQWNKYYKISCVSDDGKESKMVGPFGPVGNNYFNNPKIRLQGNGINACGIRKINVYRSNTEDGEYTKIDPSKLKSFSGEGPWDQKDAIFIDTDNSTTY